MINIYLDPHHIMPTSYYVNATLYSLLSTSVSINSERSIVAESEVFEAVSIFW